jgi:hypothetical protein
VSAQAPQLGHAAGTGPSDPQKWAYRPSLPARWADIPDLSPRASRWLAAWQQCWLQPRLRSDLRIMSVHVLAGPPTAGASAVVHDGWHLGALVLVTTQEPPRMHGPICLPRYVASFSTQPTKAHSPENKIANATTVTRTFRPGTGLPLTRRASETVMIALVITEERMNQPTEPRSPR